MKRDDSLDHAIIGQLSQDARPRFSGGAPGCGNWSAGRPVWSGRIRQWTVLLLACGAREKKYREQVVARRCGTHTMAVGMAGWTTGAVFLLSSLSSLILIPDVCES